MGTGNLLKQSLSERETERSLHSQWGAGSEGQKPCLAPGRAPVAPAAPQPSELRARLRLPGRWGGTPTLAGAASAPLSAPPLARAARRCPHSRSPGPFRGTQSPGALPGAPRGKRLPRSGRRKRGGAKARQGQGRAGQGREQSRAAGAGRHRSPPGSPEAERPALPAGGSRAALAAPQTYERLTEPAAAPGTGRSLLRAP